MRRPYLTSATVLAALWWLTLLGSYATNNGFLFIAAIAILVISSFGVFPLTLILAIISLKKSEGNNWLAYSILGLSVIMIILALVFGMSVLQDSNKLWK
jgi:hypothetical protein